MKLDLKVDLKVRKVDEGAGDLDGKGTLAANRKLLVQLA